MRGGSAKQMIHPDRQDRLYNKESTMTEINANSPLRNINPPVTGVNPPLDNGSPVNPVSNDIHAPAQNVVQNGTEAKSLSLKLDSMMIRAAQLATRSVDVDALAETVKDVPLDDAAWTALEGAAERANSALSELSQLSGREIAEAIEDKDGRLDFKADNEAAEAIREAIDAQAELSEMLHKLVNSPHTNADVADQLARAAQDDLNAVQGVIIGLDRFWDALWEEMLVYAPVYSKLQQLTLLENGEPDYLMDFHYSGFNSIDDLTENHLAVWPNPATETVYIEGSEVAEVQVYNALGQMVKTVRGTNEIDLSGLVNGVYLLRVTDADGKNHVARVAVKE